MPHVEVPFEIYSKLVNRRTRQLRIDAIDGIPPSLAENEQELINRALDDLVAWNDEHEIVMRVMKV